MDSRQSIYWHQGLFLQPQHFQYLEMHQQFLRQPLVKMVSPYPWGLGDLQIADQALANRVFEIRQLKLLLPDQSYLEFPGNTIIAPRSFDASWAQMDEPLNVYLGIRRLSPAIANATVIDHASEFDKVQTRFASLSNADEVRDVYSNGTDAPVPTLVHVAKIFFESEIPTLDDYDLFFLAQLERGNEQIRIVPNQVPAVYSVEASHYLQKLIQDIRDDMLGRLRQLEEYKAPVGALSDQLDASFLMMMQAVQALNRHVPILTHYLETSHVHPWDVYGALRVCAGELSTFSQRLDLYGRITGQEEGTGIPRYDHRKLGWCFDQVKRLISEMLSEVAVGPELRVVLTQSDGIIFSGNIPSEYFAPRNRFFLVLQSEGMHEVDAEQFLSSGRLAAASVLPNLIDHALPGLELIELSGPPQGLPRRSDAKYFRIEQISSEWETVAAEGAISLYWLDAPTDLRAIVVVTRG